MTEVNPWPTPVTYAGLELALDAIEGFVARRNDVSEAALALLAEFRREVGA
jgi:hypothetical protein